MNSALAGAAPAALLRVTDAARTDVGLVRSGNEDALLRRPTARLWAVADGMGGHEDGEWASATIVQALDRVGINGDFEADCARVADGIHAANAAIRRRAEHHRLQMGSTVTALLLGEDRYAVFWAGDSRAYRLRDGVLAPLTSDHTQVQARVDRGLLTADEARSHPMAHVLTRAVGVGELDLATARGPAQCGDVFLLCSDGLHGPATDAEIRDRLLAADPEAACDALVALSHARGAPDNVTVIVARIA